MESKVGFLKGLDRDSSISKRDPNSYYDALNIRVLTDDGLSTGSITNEKGNSLLFKMPNSIASSYRFTSTNISADELVISTSIHVRPIDFSTCTTVLDAYNKVMADIGVQEDIADGFYKVFYNNNHIYIIGLTNLAGCINGAGVGHPLVQLLNTGAGAFSIIGVGTMRDWLVIFTTDPNNVGSGQIWKCQYDKVNGIINGLDVLGCLVPATHLVYSGTLGFSASSRIGEIISRYQDSTHGKVFFIDGINPIKHINILDPNSLALSLSEIDVAPDVIFTQPIVTDVIKGGALRSGSIQYSYQLFNEGGSETSFAPASGIVHLTSYNEKEANTLKYKGTATDTDVTKSVIVNITGIDTSFDYIRLISIYYTSQEGAPEINIVEERLIPTSGEVEFTDDGNPIGVYSTTEYNTSGVRTFIPNTITTKNNYLVAANISEDYFDLDDPIYWDARAYRWRNDGLYFRLDGYDYNDTPSAIIETADCITLRADQGLDYKYNQTSHHLGGTGSNISYEFVLNQIKICDNTTDSSAYVDKVPSAQDWSIKIDGSYADNTSYTSYASPINREQLVGYTRNEIYRFGIVFFDAKGRQSFAKWIGDIKMPSIGESDTAKVTYNTDPIGGTGVDKHDYNTTFLGTDGSTYANILGVTFTINNYPAEAIGHRIVRVRREQKDKYILGQGLMGIGKDMGDSSSNIATAKHLAEAVWIPMGDTWSPFYYDDMASDYFAGFPIIEPYMVTFKSPEVLFTNSITPINGDVITAVAYTDSVVYSIVPGDTADIYKNVFITKIKSLTPITTTITAEVQDGIKAEDTYKQDVNYRYVIQNASVPNKTRFLNHGLPNGTVAGAPYKGSVLVLGLKDILTVADVDKWVILNYTKDPSYVQYGGNNYYDRINNAYIACGNLSISNTCTVYGGDTFISMWEYLNAMEYVHTDMADVVETELSEVVYIPLESTINTELGNGTYYSKDSGDYKLCETVTFGSSIQTTYPANYTDMYQYNPAYSVEPIGKTYTIKPLFFSNNKVNDYRVIVSEKHINNQMSDNWTKFLYNNMIEVTSAYGPISKIITFRNQLFFFQDNAFGILAFEDRQLLKDNTGSQLTLGTGTILQNFRYISEKTGTKSKFGVIDTGSYLYFVDLNNRKFMRFTGDTDECVSDKDNLSSFFRTFDYGDALLFDHTASGTGIHGVFDPINKRVLYTMLGTDRKTFSYNEVLSNFESFYSFVPNIYENTDFGIVSVDPANLEHLYLHVAGKRGEWYGTAYPSYITHTLAPNPDVKKVFTNLDYNSYVEIAGVDQPLITATNITLWNSYQNTGVITLTNPTTVRRRFRTWRYQLPRVSSLRLSDYTLFAKLSFTNSNVTDTYFRLDDITIHYLVPML
jgi:hypothetical protein